MNSVSSTYSSRVRALLTALSLVVGCAHRPALAPPDPALLVPWSPVAQAALPDLPYVARYVRGAKRLSYVAATHQIDEPNPVFPLVVAEFEVLSPDAIVIEGIPTDLGASPPALVDDCAVSRASGRWEGGEAAFAACLAAERGVPFYGGEPDTRAVVARVLAEGYDRKDLCYFYVVRQVGQWQREGALAERPFESLYADFVADWAPPLGVSVDAVADPAGFVAWFESKNGFAFDPKVADPSWAAPVAGPEALFTQRLSHLTGVARDGHILELTSTLLAAHERVLVVYGAGHHTAQAPALEAMMGPPEFSP